MQVMAALAEIARRRAEGPALPEIPWAVRVAEAIEEPAVDAAERKPEDLDDIAARLIQAFGAGVEPSRRDLNRAAWCVWEGRRPLAGEPDALRGYLNFVRESGRRAAFRRLASAYLTAFEPAPSTAVRGASLRTVAAVLEALAPNFSGPYAVASRALSLFDPDRGPPAIAQAALTKGSSPSKVLDEFGIRNIAAEGGLAEAAFLAGLEQLGADRSLTHDRRLEAIMAWGLRRDGSVQYERHRGPLVDALVLPHGEALPPRDVMDRQLRFLISHFGHPRLRHANWEPMRTAATVRRWLTSLSLRQFLDVVDRGAYDAQWRYRRAFWEAVHRRELIADAWVIFDQVGDDAARDLFKVNAPYARFTSGGRKQIQRGHAVLLLRIGNGIIAEWSHNGRCNVWHSADDPTAPRMNARHYDTDEVRLRGASTEAHRRAEITHAGSEGYHWQAKVAAEIHALTNVRILEKEYRLI